eukprot:30647-Pelagococcus_subviridis.AAC.2
MLSSSPSSLLLLSRGITYTFPACGSPWTCPCTNVISANTLAIAAPTRLGENPAAASSPGSLHRVMFGTNLVVSTRILRAPLRVTSLALEVQLRSERHLKVLHDPREVEPSRFDLLREHVEHREIAREVPPKPRVLHLHRDLRSVLRDRAVHLSERRRRDGHLVHARERLRRADAELLREALVHDVERVERRFIREHGERLHVRLGDPGVARAALQRRDELRGFVVYPSVGLRELEALRCGLAVRPLELSRVVGGRLVQRRVLLLRGLEQLHRDHRASHAEAHVRARGGWIRRFGRRRRGGFPFGRRRRRRRDRRGRRRGSGRGSGRGSVIVD